ncbi:MAG TPA: histidine kinase [Acidimicrobiales bacterium]|nr:histidine kinase [Acidimicrobiales bacterium]
MPAGDVRSGRAVAGVVFALIGTGFLLESAGLWTVQLVYVWPLILIGVGVQFLVGRARRIEIEERRLEIEEHRTARLAVAEERVRIARELHDIVAHGVSLMTIQIAAARRAAPRSPELADQALAAAEQAGRQSLTELRNLLAVLRGADASLGDAARPPSGDPSGWQARAPGWGTTGSPPPAPEAAPTAPLPRLTDIPDLVDTLRTAGLDAHLDVIGEIPPTVSPGVQLAAYRVVQESLTNVVRHAPRATVRIELDYAPNSVDVVVDDDGAGHVPPPPAGDGHGLVGMRERVAAAGGTLDLGPRAGRPGWRVHARFPVPLAS